MMRRLTHSLAAKIAACFLLLVSLTAALGGAACVVYMADRGYYSAEGRSFYDSPFCADITLGYAQEVFNGYFALSQKDSPNAEEAFRLRQYQNRFSKGNTNFFFTVTDKNGRVMLSNYEEQDYGTQLSYSYDRPKVSGGGAYVVDCYVKDPITAKDNYYTPYRIFNILYSMRYGIIAIAVLSAVFALLLFIFLMCAAGRRKGSEGIALNAWDRIPFDLDAAGVFMCLLALIAVNYNTWYGAWLVFGVVGALIGVLLTLALCMTFAARVKAGRWWQNTVIYRILKLTGRFCRRAAGAAGTVINSLPLLWKTVLGFCGYLFINAVTLILFMNTRGEAVFFLFGLMFNLAALLGLCFLTLQMNALKQGAGRIAGGDLGCIDAKNMFWDFKQHALTLNNIGLGMSKAVEERLKSERLKTELITNVSHDIKTPLTSIMNYVDLLKKEPIENAAALQYIEVLDRQSARLKKLTEDLTEAAKAATGNISQSPVRTDVIELINQSVGEYVERFAAGGLETVIRTPQSGAAIFADGRLLWRVFDNLLNNIAKYSQKDTRVYLDVENTSGRVTVTLRNISRDPLNITSDELLERFVRGDSARTTEGSGLGLSIAKSLVQLQKGSFDLSVDGDLFKIVIGFDAVA